MFKRSDMVCRVAEERRERLAKIVEQLPSDEEVIELAAFFSALGDATRAKIMLALNVGELTTCELSKITGLSVSAVSHQLRVLRDRKLVAYRREGRSVLYRVDDDHIRRILEIALVHLRER